MIHEITKTMYQEYHKMGYLTELVVVAGDKDNPVNESNYIATIVCNLFKRENREPVMGMILHVGDTSKDEKEMKLDYTLADFQMYQSDLSFGEVAGMFGATRSMMYRLLQMPIDKLFEKEAILNHMNCSLESIRVSDMSDILDGIGGAPRPELEYHFGVKRIGKAILHITEANVVDNAPDVELQNCNPDALQDMLSLLNEGDIPMENAGDLVLKYNDAIIGLVGQVAGTIALPFAKDEIMVSFQTVAAVIPDSKE